MKVTGIKISNMERERKFGQMDHGMRENTNKERSMGKENSFGLISHNTLEISKIITYMVEDCISGLIREGLKESGSTTKWMG